MPEIDLKKEALDLISKIVSLKADLSPLEIVFMKELLRKIGCSTCKVTEGHIKYLKGIEKRVVG